jgi:hypothetical protein
MIMVFPLDYSSLIITDNLLNYDFKPITHHFL